MFLGSADDPAIAYSTAPLSNVVDDLNRRLQDGSARLTFEGRSGYLASALDALTLPADSQLLLFSKGSLQGRLIGPANPRALFFNDRVALGWVRDGDLLEVAAHDARAGVVFYSLEQRPDGTPGVQARVPVSRLPHDRRHVGRSRPADVQRDARRRRATDT